MELMFRTVFGSEYYRKEDGFWVRHKYTGEEFDDYVYFGSIDSSQNTAFVDDRHYREEDIHEQFGRGTILGLSAEFSVGNHPFGLIGIKPGDLEFYEGVLRPTPQVDPKTLVQIHIGDRISEVMRTI